MRIVITDSGLGGLSVTAAVESRLTEMPVVDDVELVYLNAALRDDYGYNSMPTRQEKLATFDGFLGTVAERYEPDLIYVACNSLSVLLPDCRSERHRHVPIAGIVETGTAAILSELSQDEQASVMVFATPTTVDESTHRDNLLNAGVAPQRIVQQACPGLADAISHDHTGQEAEALLGQFIPEAVGRFEVTPGRVVAFLGCTHYGYQADVFLRLLKQEVASVSMLNPNAGAADEILAKIATAPGAGGLSVRLATPYAIPEASRVSLAHYLGDQAPLACAALQNFTVDPGLYPHA